jgi:hypothetical protein
LASPAVLLMFSSPKSPPARLSAPPFVASPVAPGAALGRGERRRKGRATCASRPAPRADAGKLSRAEQGDRRCARSTEAAEQGDWRRAWTMGAAEEGDRRCTWSIGAAEPHRLVLKERSGG